MAKTITYEIRENLEFRYVKAPEEFDEKDFQVKKVGSCINLYRENKRVKELVYNFEKDEIKGINNIIKNVLDYFGFFYTTEPYKKEMLGKYEVDGSGKKIYQSFSFPSEENIVYFEEHLSGLVHTLIFEGIELFLGGKNLSNRKVGE